MEICKICNREFKSKQSLGSHVSRIHNMSGEQYYLKYIGDRGICSCGKPTQFIGLGVGYRPYCSSSCAYHDPEVTRKRESTMIDRYGASTVGASSEIRATITKSMADKYGVDNVAKLQSTKDKIRITNKRKYGVDYAFLSKDSYDVRHMNRVETMKIKYSDLITKFDCDIIDTTNVDSDANIHVTYRCNKCGSIMTESWQFFTVCRLNRAYTPCTTCLPKATGKSLFENEIAEFIESFQFDINRNVRNVIPPRELDIYIPEMKIAIEFNGLYFHSELYKDSLYHYLKTDECVNQGIRLIHIYEDDWLYKNDIVKSRINNLLGISERIYARKCIIKEVNSTDANLFLEANHIQGKCRSKCKYGLYYKNELVSIMTFGKSRFADEYELIRFCNKLNTTIVGGASKLFKHFTMSYRNIKSIISYADRSWSIGGLYEQLGFKLDSITSPGYSYINGNMRENRMKYQKHKLVAAGYDKNLSEHDIMISRKIYRIYDSGHLKYVWNR